MSNAPEYSFEGFGEEVLWTFGVVFSIIVGIVILLAVKGSARSTGIHPQQQETVDRARNRLREDAGNRAHPEAADFADVPQCPVCLGGVVYPVETNCGHVFCAQCVLTYWHADRWPSTCRCPVCRREVTLLMTDPRLEQSGHYQELHGRVLDYNQRMSGEWRSLMSYIYDIPPLLRHLWHDLFTVGGLLCVHRLHILIVLFLLVLYVILPLDILPESFLGVLGFVDDLVIVLGALIYLTLMYRAYITHRQMTGG